MKRGLMKILYASFAVLRTKEGNMYDEIELKETSIANILQALNENINMKMAKPALHPLVITYECQ